MKFKEKFDICFYAACLTDESLEQEYYDTLSLCLGSQCEAMYDLGYDISDILEREKYEKFLSQKLDLLENFCVQRGIKLFE